MKKKLGSNTIIVLEAKTKMDPHKTVSVLKSIITIPNPQKYIYKTNPNQVVVELNIHRIGNKSNQKHYVLAPKNNGVNSL